MQSNQFHTQNKHSLKHIMIHHTHTQTLALPPQVVQRRVDLLQQEGIQFRVKVEVGKDVLAKDLMKENDAVLLALGLSLIHI